jgi:hypothetical protein
MSPVEKAKEEAKRLERELHLYVQREIRKIEALSDKHGFIHQFTGLPPFDAYGNSGWYYPVKDGEPWFGSEYSDDYVPNEHGLLEGWVSSDQGC